MNKFRIRLLAILGVCIAVIITGIIFATTTYLRGDTVGAVISAIISTIIVAFAIFTYVRGNRDLKAGIPYRDERGRKVIEKASSISFILSIYLLLAIGFFEKFFRDVSQATGLAIGVMAIIFAVSWVYYNRQELWKQE